VTKWPQQVPGWSHVPQLKDWLGVFTGQLDRFMHDHWIYTGVEGKKVGYPSSYSIQVGPFEDFAETFAWTVDNRVGIYAPVGTQGEGYGSPSPQRLWALAVALFP